MRSRLALAALVAASLAACTPKADLLDRELGPLGGRLAPENAGVEIDFPAGAVTRTTATAVTPVGDAEVPAGVVRVSPVFRIEPGAARLARPATVRLVVEEGRIPGGRDRADIRGYLVHDGITRLDPGDMDVETEAPDAETTDGDPETADEGEGTEVSSREADVLPPADDDEEDAPPPADDDEEDAPPPADDDAESSTDAANDAGTEAEEAPIALPPCSPAPRAVKALKDGRYEFVIDCLGTVLLGIGARTDETDTANGGR